MIDLRVKGLPDHIIVAGKSYFLDTDFREWLEFGERLKKDNCTLYDIGFVIKDITALELTQHMDEFISQLIGFYKNINSTPNDNTQDSEAILDYIQDGEYIVGSFMQAYGIDLTSCDMHWHMFKALFMSLPEDTKIKQIMSMRSYKKDNTSYEEQCRKLKHIWKLPTTLNTVDEALMEDINAEFYNT